MNAILVLNLAGVVAAALLPNEFLMWHSYVLYAFQLLTLGGYLLRRTALVEYLFMPTTFALGYFLVNLTLGSYLVPREFGWYKGFTTAALEIKHYNAIVPFLMLANIMLFVVSVRTLRRLAALPRRAAHAHASGIGPAALKLVLFFGAFLAITILSEKIYSAYSFQLAIAILHLTDPSLRRKWLRFSAYAFYLLALTAFGYDNKREIAMLLFLVVFLEAHFTRSALRFSLASVTVYAVAAASFFGLVLAASILRGYGDFQVVSLLDALTYIPQYMTSDLFVDGVTDNLELNYSYGTAVTAMDHGIRSLL